MVAMFIAHWRSKLPVPLFLSLLKAHCRPQQDFSHHLLSSMTAEHLDIVQLAVLMYIGHSQGTTPRTGLLKDQFTLETSPATIPLLNTQCQNHWGR